MWLSFNYISEECKFRVKDSKLIEPAFTEKDNAVIYSNENYFKIDKCIEEIGGKHTFIKKLSEKVQKTLWEIASKMIECDRYKSFFLKKFSKLT